MRVQNWCFTYYFPDDLMTLPLVLTSLPPKTHYLCYGTEVCPETKRLHLQGFIQLDTNQRMSYLQKLLKCTWHPCNGSPEQNVAYCKKEGEFYEFGKMTSQGNRSDILALKAAVDSGASMATLYSDYFATYSRTKNFVDGYKRHKMAKRNWVPIVIVFWGPTGTGKTRSLTELASRLGSVYRVPQAKGSGLYYDGYDGEDVLFLDEVYGNRMSYSSMLELCDRYSCTLPVHQGPGFQCQAKYILMTSNTHPSQWYKNIDTYALKRRITWLQYFPRRFSQIRGIHTNTQSQNQLTSFSNHK